MGIKSFASKLYASFLISKMKSWNHDAINIQNRVLRELIELAKETKFGKDHQFSEIKNYDDFKKLIPIRDYEQLKEPYINLMVKGDENILWPGKPLYFSKTSGTTSGVKYIPIGIIEYLLTRIFSKWRVEIKESKLLANSVQVTVRLHFLDPVSGEWDWQDGIGASPLQTDKGAGAIEFDKIKNGAVMMAAPAAESYAIKDAAEKLGKLFGKDLNRKDVIGYNSLLAVNESRESKELTPEHKRWNDAVKSLREGNATIDEICSNYLVSEFNREKLMSDAI
jgi:hypothetical protein